MVNVIGLQIQNGATFSDAMTSDDIAEGFPMAFRTVLPEYYRDYVGYGVWFYESLDFPLLQCFWPDRERRFPWDNGCDDGCKRAQALIQASIG